jgi:outer membrane protein TolC
MYFAKDNRIAGGGSAALAAAAVLCALAPGATAQNLSRDAIAGGVTIVALAPAAVSASMLPDAPSASRHLGGFDTNQAAQEATPLSLSLDDAVALGLKGDTQILLAGQQERFVHGQILTVGNALLPSLKVTAYTKAQEINLAGMGFKPTTLAGIPAFSSFKIAEIVKVNTTNAQISLSQALFNVPAYFLYRSTQKASEAAALNTLNQRGGVVENVGTLYLRALADQAQIANAAALVKQDEVVLRHAQDSDAAGVGVHIDVLRAQVQLQSEQQTLIADENALAKDKIALNRAMGIAANQELVLNDTVPFAELEELTLEDAKALAYSRRKDLLGLEAQQAVADEARKAVKYQYLPTVTVSGFYGVLGVTNGSYHGDFQAGGTLRFPIFNEAQFRGEREVAAAQAVALRQQVASLKDTIEAQIRSGMLDVESSAELVKVARSNVQLAQQELDDATLRYTSGVDDNLPVVRAQASLAGAQAQVVQAEYQYNVSKLELARRTGVVETQYKHYLGR